MKCFSERVTETKGRQSDNFVVTGSTVSCRNDN